jgi:glycosyltransferase involved in cell wall biosynthesis
MSSLDNSDFAYQLICPAFRSTEAPALPHVQRVDLRFLRTLGTEGVVSRILAWLLLNLCAFVKVLTCRKEVLAVQYESIYSFPAAFLAKILCRCPTIGDDILISGNSRLSPLVARVVMSATDLVLSSTESTPLSKIDPNRILEVTNGIDEGFVVHHRSINFQKTRAVFIGALSYEANRRAVGHLLELSSQLPKGSTEFLVVGGPVPREFWENENVKFLGFLDDASLLQVYGGANVGVLPFFGIPAEGSKVKVLEYMAAQLLVVSCPEGVKGYPDLVPWEHYVPVASLRDMKEALMEIPREPHLYAKIARRAHRLALARYQWPRLLRDYLSFLKTITTQ